MFKKIRAVVFDLDGTIYYGSKIIDGANEVIDYFTRLGKEIYFLTNNSTKTRKQIYEKLVGIGVNCSLEQVYSSGYIAAVYAKKEGISNIYIFGSNNLVDEFKEQGINIELDESKAENLLIGYDTEFTYDKLTKALNVALNSKSIIACNKERYFPGDNAEILPGCGAMVGAIEHCTKRKADIVIGKPNVLPLKVIAEVKGFDKDDILMVGDSYESDILMANKYGCKSVLIGDKLYEGEIVVRNIVDILKLL